VFGFGVSPSERHKFTGKERDIESGLDYFGARYMSSTQGRFTSADAPFADQRPSDPQSWNLYAYVRNNPLRFIDPTGRAIQLTGETEEERQAALEAIRASLVDSKVADQLSITPSDDGKFFVDVEGSIIDFQKAGDLEAGLGALIASDTVVDFQLSDTVERQSGPSFLPDFFSVQSLPVGERYGGEVVDNIGVTPSGRITVTIDPTDIRDRQAGREGIPRATLRETTAHGLGHAQAFVQGVIGAGNDRFAVGAENAARRRGGPQRRQKQRHNDLIGR